MQIRMLASPVLLAPGQRRRLVERKEDEEGLEEGRRRRGRRRKGGKEERKKERNEARLKHVLGYVSHTATHQNLLTYSLHTE